MPSTRTPHVSRKARYTEVGSDGMTEVTCTADIDTIRKLVHEANELLSDQLAGDASMSGRFIDYLSETACLVASMDGDEVDEHAVRAAAHNFFAKPFFADPRAFGAKLDAAVARYHRLVKVRVCLEVPMPVACTSCGGHLDMIDAEAVEGCVNCGKLYSSGCSGTAQKNLTYDQLKTVNPAPIKFCYERIAYLRENLLEMQALEYAAIDQDILDRILLQLKMERVSSLEGLGKLQWKGILRRAGLPKLYEHWRSIQYALDGCKPPRIDPELQSQLETMFLMAETAFVKHKHLLENHRTPRRKALLNYSYVIRKLFEILGRPDHARWWPFLKNQQKMAVYDKVWERITQDLNWPFYKSV